MVSACIYLEGGAKGPDSKFITIACQQESALPSLYQLEQRARHDVQGKLMDATRNCKNAYSKGKQSYLVLGELDPDVLKKHLPSFVRVHRILDDKL